EMLAYQQKESTARVASIMENTNLSKQQQVSEIMRQMLTQAQTAGQYFTNDQIKEIWIKFMKDGVNATPLPTVNTTGYIDHAAFLGTINPDTNKIPKHLFQGYLNIYNNYFKAPWMPDRT